MYLIRVPSLSENVDQATISRWLIKENEAVTWGTPIAELITEKAEFTLEAEEGVDGLVLNRFAPEKSVVPVGYILAAVGRDESQEEISAIRETNSLLLRNQSTSPTRSIQGSELNELKEALALSKGKVRATPAARRMAKENDVSLTDVANKYAITGVITEMHVQSFLACTDR